jgi:hypothetical protein
MSHRWWIPILTAVAAAVGACATLQQVTALRHVDFDVVGVRNGRLAGVDLARVSSYRNLTAVDLARITVAVSSNDLPLEFQVDVRGENPADNKVTAKLVQLSWSLFLNDKETISGVLDTAVALPPGEPVVIPMQMRLDLAEFFEGPAQDLVDLAAAIAGLKADPTVVSLRAIPTIDTPLGPIRYPSPITIKSRTVGGGSRP